MYQLYTLTVLMSFIGLSGCYQNQSKDETTTPTTGSTAPIVQTSSLSKSVAEIPEAVVHALYEAHNAKKSPFFQATDRALVNKFFVEEMVDLIWDDAVIVAKTGEIAFMEADPLYNAQDLDIQDFMIHPAEVSDDQAEVLVTFTNFGEKQEFTFLLDKENGTWLISDIFYGDGSQLFQLLSGRSEETP